MHKVNVKQKLALFSEHWTQKIVAQSNGQLIKVAKGQGELQWHRHDDEDELFFICKGSMTIQLRDGDVELGEGDLFVVPKGVEHCPVADEEVEFMIIGPSVTSDESAWI